MIPGMRHQAPSKRYAKYMQYSPIGYQQNSTKVPRDSFLKPREAVEGSKPDVHGHRKNIKTWEHISVRDIVGAQPEKVKFTNKSSFNLVSKDATGELGKRKIVKQYDSLDPVYVALDKTKSGR